MKINGSETTATIVKTMTQFSFINFDTSENSNLIKNIKVAGIAGIKYKDP